MNGMTAEEDTLVGDVASLSGKPTLPCINGHRSKPDPADIAPGCMAQCCACSYAVAATDAPPDGADPPDESPTVSKSSRKKKKV